jgi:hypothetical protein
MAANLGKTRGSGSQIDEPGFFDAEAGEESEED